MTAGSVQILESKFSTGKCLQCCEDPFLTGKSTFSKCKNGQCIKSDLFCDGYKNCEDGSDEVGYDIGIRGFPLDFMGSYVFGKFSCKNYFHISISSIALINVVDQQLIPTCNIKTMK